MTGEEILRRFAERTPAADVEDDVGPMRAMTPNERGRVLAALTRMAASQVSQHPDPTRVLEWRDEISPESAAILARLRNRSRQRG